MFTTTTAMVYPTIKELKHGLGFRSLLTRNQPKLKKGEKQGYLSSGIHLAPANKSGFNTCAFASEGCRAACLNVSGHGGIGLDSEGLNDIQRVRIARTILLFTDRSRWMQIFEVEMRRFLRKAIRLNLIPVFRPNLTSDIQWEKFPVIRNGVTFPNMFEAYPEVIFYDYTAFPPARRSKALSIRNYTLTFSLKEDNDETALQALDVGLNVAVAIRAKIHNLPSTWSGLPVIDGDNDDLRFLDPKGGHIVGLSPKGIKAMKDDSGFVREIDAVIGQLADVAA